MTGNKTGAVESVKLFTGLIFGEFESYHSTLEELERKFGPIQFESETFEFDHTDYYEKEMGPKLKRGFVAFTRSVSPEQIKEAKLATARMEKKSADSSGRRRINIDPGTVGLANMVLASTKDFAHRIYLGEGIFAEVSMLYRDRSFRPLPWTYPDYQRLEVVEFFLRIRESLKEEIIALRGKN